MGGMVIETWDVSPRGGPGQRVSAEWDKHDGYFVVVLEEGHDRIWRDVRKPTYYGNRFDRMIAGARRTAKAQAARNGTRAKMTYRAAPPSPVAKSIVRHVRKTARRGRRSR